MSLASAYDTLRPNGTTRTQPPLQIPIQLAAFHTRGVATVRLRLVSGAWREMQPVHGWVAFAAPGTVDDLPFRLRSVEGLDTHGKRVATTVVFRCC